MHSITCRKRHLKCDENKPSCSLCIKSTQTCIYSQGFITNSSSTESVTPRPASPERAVSHTQPYEASQPVQQVSKYVQDHMAWVSNLQDEQNVRAGNTALALTPSQSITNSPENTYIQNTLPRNLSYHSGPSPNSADDGVAGSVASSGPVLDVAIAKWFELLAGDADLENNGFLNAEGEVSYDLNALETPNEQSFRRLPIMQPPVQIPQDLERGELSVCRTSLYSKGQIIGQAVAEVQENKPWQSSETLVLLGHENSIFENFVKRVAPWVRLLIRMKIQANNCFVD
jgi:Fungal Zn(2)-Cys(6) binuclear cluster domain